MNDKVAVWLVRESDTIDHSEQVGYHCPMKERTTGFPDVEDRGSEAPDLVDLATLHKAAKRLKPRIAVAFGGAQATITLAHAIATNGMGQLYSVHASEDHTLSIRARMPPQLAAVTSFWYTLAGNLPEVVPDMIYVGAGGLGEAVNDNPMGRVLASILHYEPKLKLGTVIVADTQIDAIVSGLKRRWRRRWSVLDRPAILVLRK